MYIIQCLLLGLLLATPALAQDDSGFAGWKQNFLASAAQKGVSSATLKQAAPYLKFLPKVIEFDQRQPEKTQSFAQYLSQTMTPQRLAQAKQYFDQYHDQLREIEQKYQVPAEVIMALWAKESSFGQNQGKYNILSSLATLAYEGRRATFFSSELLAALQMIDQNAATPETLTGSWAGAMGQCQFMPSSYLKFAADGDGDNRADIWGNEADVFASIANYLHNSGWTYLTGIAQPVTLPDEFDASLIDLKIVKPVTEWHALGLRRDNGMPLYLSGVPASVVQPDGPGTPAYLAYNNFRTLMKWNRSTYFGLAIAQIAVTLNSAQPDNN